MMTDVAFTVSGTLKEPGFLRLSLPKTKNGNTDPYVFSLNSSVDSGLVRF